ncbi:chitin-binding, type 1 protein [Tanacetum coccineum]
MNSFLLVTILVLVATVSAQDCGTQGGNRPCTNGNCCSQYGFCGNTPAHCSPANKCQSQCSGSGTTPTPGPGTGGDVASIVTSSIFDQMLKYRNDPRCHANGFYSYSAFINAASNYNGFGTTGSVDDRKRELAAFFAQTSHETTGGWPTAPDGQFAWGYCFVREQDQTNNYCDSPAWPCPQSYFGRGPIQLSHNYNYGLFGRTINTDLINNPDLLATDPTISFRSAIWFWMTPQDNKPSSHAVITGSWSPSAADRSAGRISGYGVITNIINGGLECGKGQNDKVEDRIGFYRVSPIWFRNCKSCELSIVDYLLNTPLALQQIQLMAIPVQNINHSAFRSMFEKEKLSGNNFNDWFARLKLVLRVEKKMHVIEQPLPPAPEAGAEPNIVAQWTALYDAHTEIACLMLGSMTPELHRQFELHYPYDMIQELRSMFEKQAGVEKFDLIQSFHACKQEEGALSFEWAFTKDFVGFYEKGLPKKAETPQVMMIKSGKIQKANKKSLNAKGKNKGCAHPAKEMPATPLVRSVGHWKRMLCVSCELQKKEEVQVGSATQNLGLNAIADAGFKNDRVDTRVSILGYVFVLNGALVDLAKKRRAPSKVPLQWLGIVPTINEPLNMYCDNSAAVHYANEPGSRQYGFCGNTPAHCSPANKCQSQCSGSGTTPTPGPGTGGDVASIVTSSIFDQMLKWMALTEPDGQFAWGIASLEYTAADRSAGRISGYGVITNIINGGLECGKGQNDKVEDRIGFYRGYCSILGVSPGDNLDCYNQTPFNQ